MRVVIVNQRVQDLQWIADVGFKDFDGVILSCQVPVSGQPEETSVRLEIMSSKFLVWDSFYVSVESRAQP